MSGKENTRIKKAIEDDRTFSIMQQIKQDEVLRKQVLKWVFNQGFHKEYRKCSQCGEVGETKEYHGRLCHECTKDYRRKNYAANNPPTKKKATKKE